MSKIITMEALYDYLSRKNHSFHFSAKDESVALCLRTQGKMKFDSGDTEDGLLKVSLKACHVGKNRNGSSITKEAMQKALPSFYSRPILGYIHEVDGEYEFKSHEMTVDDDGNIVYEEIPVGVITSKEGSLVYDFENEKDYAVVEGVIWEDYTKAADILREHGAEDCSVELMIYDLSYDAKDKALVINDFIFYGVTILGKTDDGREVEPGMKGSCIQIVGDFDLSSYRTDEITSSDELSVFAELSNDKKSEERRTTKVARTTKKVVLDSNEATEVKSDGVEQKTVFDDGDVGETSDASDASGDDSADPVEAPVEQPIEDLSNPDEATDSGNEGIDSGSEPEPELVVAEETSDNEVGDPVEPEPVADATSVEEPVVVEANEPVANEPLAAPALTSANGSGGDVANSEGTDEDQLGADDKKKKLYGYAKKVFELSLSERSWAVTDLVNATYGYDDDEIYSCDVYESYVVMKPWFGMQCYKQNYVCENDVFSLVGERIAVFAEYVTESEREALNMMRTTYESLMKYKEETENAKIEAEKSAVFAMFDEELKDDDSFIALKKNRAKYSASEIELQCNAIVGKKTMQFALAKSKEKPKTVRLGFSDDDKKSKNPYGGLFADKDKK